MKPNPRRYPKTGERYIDHGDEHGKGQGLYCFAAENHGPGKCRAEDHEIVPDDYPLGQPSTKGAGKDGA